jgi:hypothetical protein
MALRSSGVASTLLISALSLATIAGGVPAGATKPVQKSATTSYYWSQLGSSWARAREKSLKNFGLVPLRWRRSGLDFQRELSDRNVALSYCFSDRAWRCPDVSARYEGRCDRVSNQAFPRPGFVGCAVQAAVDRDRSTRQDAELLNELRRRFDTLTPRERTVA